MTLLRFFRNTTKPIDFAVAYGPANRSATLATRAQSYILSSHKLMEGGAVRFSQLIANGVGLGETLARFTHP
jgi:hypothetical protein